MKRKYLGTAPAPRERWMVSYLDVLTILLIFFLIAAAKTLETPSHAQAASPAAAAQPVPATPEKATPAEAKAEQPPRTDLLHAATLLQAEGLDPKLEARGLVVNLSQVILFPSGDDTVGAAALPALAQIAAVIRDIPNPVSLVGYADTVPIHNRRFSSNWDLSMSRSRKILEILSTRFGVPESRLSIASYGPYRPAAPNDTADGRASNRRVEIVILDDSLKMPSAKTADK